VVLPLRYCEIGPADVMVWCKCCVALALRDGVFLLESFIACLRLRRALRCDRVLERFPNAVDNRAMRLVWTLLAHSSEFPVSGGTIYAAHWSSPLQIRPMVAPLCLVFAYRYGQVIYLKSKGEFITAGQVAVQVALSPMPRAADITAIKGPYTLHGDWHFVMLV
jgi:hypothetical protein